MKDINKPHIGRAIAVETTKDGTNYTSEIHRANDLTPAEIKSSLAENHGIDPDLFEVKRNQAYTDPKGRKSFGFAGAWASASATWEPTGPTPNYGYTPNMN